MTSPGGGQCAGRDVTGADRPAVRSPGGWGRAQSPSVVTGGGGPLACQRSRIKTSPRPAFSLRLQSVLLRSRARCARAAASLGWPRVAARAGSRKPERARRPGWRGSGRTAGRAPEESGRPRALHSRPGAAGNSLRGRRAPGSPRAGRGDAQPQEQQRRPQKQARQQQRGRAGKWSRGLGGGGCDRRGGRRGLGSGSSGLRGGVTGRGGHRRRGGLGRCGRGRRQRRRRCGGCRRGRRQER